MFKRWFSKLQGPRLGIPLTVFPPSGVRLTRSGVLYLATAILVGLAAMNARRNLLLLIFGMQIGAMLLAGVMGTLRRLAVSRWAPDTVMAGRRFTIRYHLRNLSRWRTVYGIRVVDLLPRRWVAELPEGMAVSLGPGQTAVLAVPVLCVKRGRLKFGPLRLATSFPFGLLTRFTTLNIQQNVLVLPAVGRLKHDSPLPSEATESFVGGSTTHGPGGLDEFFGIREHRPGDSPRWIYWRRSARTGQLVVREMEPPRPRRLTIVLDTQRVGKGEEAEDRIEYLISVAATLACWGIDHKLHVGLLCSGRTPVAIPPMSGRGCSEALLRELAGLEISDRVPLDSLLSSRFPGQWRGQCIILTARPAAEVEDVRVHMSRLIGATTVWSTADGTLDHVIELTPARPAPPPAKRDRPAERRGAIALPAFAK